MIYGQDGCRTPYPLIFSNPINKDFVHLDLTAQCNNISVIKYATAQLGIPERQNEVPQSGHIIMYAGDIHESRDHGILPNTMNQICGC